MDCFPHKVTPFVLSRTQIIIPNIKPWDKVKTLDFEMYVWSRVLKVHTVPAVHWALLPKDNVRQ